MDSGKSTLLGRMRYDLGQVSEDYWKKVIRQSEDLGRQTYQATTMLLP